MKTSYLVWIIVIIIIVLGIGWYVVSRNNAATQAPIQQATTTAAAPATPAAPLPANEYVAGNLLLGSNATTTLGRYLIAFNGKTLYKYALDKSGTSTCTGACAVNWPPYIVPDTSALANLQAGITGAVSTITRADGTLQVTYKGMPLYFFVGDTQSGETKGNGVKGVWSVVKP